MNIEELRETRLSGIQAIRRNGWEAGFKRLLTDLYPDNAHFIYELLQNAEDKHASLVRFTLSETDVEFDHDGKHLFTLADVVSITSIGASTKSNDATSIGKFGIGFKAVFAYTNTPEIHSGEFHFRIHDLVVPETDSVAKPRMGERETRFNFPFDNPKKPSNKAVAEIEQGLRALGDNTLLFLSHIRKIEYLLPDGSFGSLERIDDDCGRIEIRANHPGVNDTKSHWLRFQKEVEVIEEVTCEDNENKYPVKKCQIAIAYSLAKDVDPKKGFSSWKIVPLEFGQVSIYFPAVNEKWNFRFHIHAPFASTVARDSVRDCAANDDLSVHIADLVAASLHSIRDQNLLNGAFLEVLPTLQDNIPQRYQCIRSAIINEMNNEPLTPTNTNSFAPAKHLLQAKAPLKELLLEDDIKFLVERNEEPLQWAIDRTPKNSLFLSGLAITEWNIDKFVGTLIEKASTDRYAPSPPSHLYEPDKEFINWLAVKPMEWHQHLYSLLYKELSSSHNLYTLKKLQIIRLSNNSYICGNKKCYFPTAEVEYDEMLPRVERAVYSSGENEAQQEEAKKLLEALGVCEVGEADQVQSILKQRYTAEAFKPDEKDLERFVALVENEPSQAKTFAEFYIFKRSDGKWGKPCQLFLDLPYYETGLSVYYDAIENADKKGLSDSYAKTTVVVERLVKFAVTIGVQTKLEVTGPPQITCRDNPRWEYLRQVAGERYTSSGFDRDYKILHLDDLFCSPSVELSRLVWRTMRSLAPMYLQASYCKNEHNGSRPPADSQLIHLLRTSAWVPQNDGSFVHPTEASRDRLPEGFPFDPGENWLKLIGFGEHAQKRSEEYLVRNQAARKVGFESADVAEEFAKLAKETGISADEVRSLVTRSKGVAQPEGSVLNPEKRRKGVLERRENAPTKESVIRERSIQSGVSQDIVEARAYLRAKYENQDGQLICQCCQKEMPFKVNDFHYFEAIQCVRELNKRHYENRLALCPTCAAMYRHARESNDNDVCCTIVDHDSPDTASFVVIPVKLAGREFQLRFVGTHWFDLKTILST